MEYYELGLEKARIFLGWFIRILKYFFSIFKISDMLIVIKIKKSNLTNVRWGTVCV